MIRDEWERLAAASLAELAQASLHRVRRQIVPLDATHVLWEGTRYVNFASNDYLGLTHHPAVLDAIRSTASEFGAGSGASALISGFGPAHANAENHIARWKDCEAAVLLPSGYQANHAAVQTLAAVANRAGRPIRFLLDKLCHASLIDAVRSAEGAFRVFPHNHLPKLRRLLEEALENSIQVVVTESVFSMDGDSADLLGLAHLKKEFPFVLLLDEAHATGVFGPAGGGLAAEMGLRDAVDVSVLTLSKAIGIAGGAVCGSKVFCDALVNFARAYIYSTSVPPMIAAAADAAIGVMESEPQLQERLRQISTSVRGNLSEQGWHIPTGQSPIIPIVLGSESAALSAAEHLKQQGLLVMAIRPPTVPRGSSRLRVTLSASHTDVEIGRLLDALQQLPSGMRNR